MAADASVADAERAIAERPAHAFDTTEWSTDVGLRVRCLRQLHEALVRHTEDLRPLVIAEVGSPVMLTEMARTRRPGRDGSLVRRPAREVRVDARTSAPPRSAAPSTTAGSRRSRSASSPPSSPTTYPLQISLAKLAPALAAGCTVVVKGPPERHG